jgi:hypothetical protein
LGINHLHLFLKRKRGAEMKINTKWLGGFIAAVYVTGLASSAFAQSGDSSGVIIQKTTQGDATYKIQAGGRGSGPTLAGAPPNIFGGGISGFSGWESVFVGPPVTGRPYSGQITSESIQTLADGNRITHKTTLMVYRDSLGRIRQEQTVNVLSAYPATGGPAQIVSIDDPVANVYFVLNVDRKTAQQVMTKSVTTYNSITAVPKIKIEDAPGGQPVVENLGAQTMEGVVVTGTRITRTIPAGQIGNEQPIQIVSEKWYSEELQVTVMTKHSDPRTGTLTTILTGITRAEPPAFLFVIPPDYNVQHLTGPAR